MQKNGNKIFFSKWTGNTRNGGPFYLTIDELYPIKTYKFGEIHIKGANSPAPILEAYYGARWVTHAVKWNHLGGGYETVLLTEKDKVPAQPTGPLMSRFS